VPIKEGNCSVVFSRRNSETKTDDHVTLDVAKVFGDSYPKSQPQDPSKGMDDYMGLGMEQLLSGHVTNLDTTTLKEVALERKKNSEKREAFSSPNKVHKTPR